MAFSSKKAKRRSESVKCLALHKLRRNANSNPLLLFFLCLPAYVRPLCLPAHVFHQRRFHSRAFPAHPHRRPQPRPPSPPPLPPPRPVHLRLVRLVRLPQLPRHAHIPSLPPRRAPHLPFLLPNPLILPRPVPQQIPRGDLPLQTRIRCTSPRRRYACFSHAVNAYIHCRCQCPLSSSYTVVAHAPHIFLLSDEEEGDMANVASRHARRASTSTWVGASDRFAQPSSSAAPVPPEQQDRAAGLLRRLSLGGAMTRV